MNIGIIGANGRLGRLLCQEAKARKHTVTAIIRKGEPCEKVDSVLLKSLFDLKKDDVQDFDVLLSAFGSGFEANPTINREAINHLSDLVKSTAVHLIIVGGAGCLYPDNKHIFRMYEDEHHPAFLKEISKNIFLGLQDLKETTNVNYTFVCPSVSFNYEAEKTGKYQVGTEEEVVYSSNGKSEVSYADFAVAMIDEAENSRYLKKCITICEV